MSQLKEPSKEQTKIVNSILSDRSKCLRIDSVAVIREIKIYCTYVFVTRSIIIIIGQRKNYNCTILSKCFERWRANFTLNIQCALKTRNKGPRENSWFRQSRSS
jgi:hypothetical protein